MQKLKIYKSYFTIYVPFLGERGYCWPAPPALPGYNYVFVFLISSYFLTFGSSQLKTEVLLDKVIHIQVCEEVGSW